MLRSRKSKLNPTADQVDHRGSISSASTATATDARNDSSLEDASVMHACPPQVKEDQSSNADTDLENLTTTMSSLKFVPPSVRLARGSRRGGRNTT